MSEPRWSDDLGPGSAHPDVAGWVLGALDPQDAEEFAVHLRSCTACQQAEQELRDVPRLLDAAAPPVDLPPGLQARTLRAVELAAVQDAHRTRRQRRTAGWLRRPQSSCSAEAGSPGRSADERRRSPR